MFQSEVELSSVGLDTPFGLGVWYDPERVTLEGAYSDQVTAYRARRRWIRTLEMNFLLEGKHDFVVKVVLDEREGNFRVRCDFLTACGRYAFWRLTHNQAPEVQYLIETAHLPSLTIISHPVMSLDEEFADMDPRVFSGPSRGPSTLWDRCRQVGDWVKACFRRA
jgi:hypothetical protein